MWKSLILERVETGLLAKELIQVFSTRGFGNMTAPKAVDPQDFVSSLQVS